MSDFPEKTGVTLYHILMGDKHFAEEATKAAKGTPEKRYENVSAKSSPVNDAAIVEVLFRKENDETRQKILGDIGKDAFASKVKEAIKKAKSVSLDDVLTFKSLPETYFEPLGTPALVSKGGLVIDKKKNLEEERQKVQQRVGFTGGVMWGYEEARFLSTALMVGLSHSLGRATYAENGQYNEKTVSYTLLTFSYFGAKESGVKDETWFFYWKVFGSLMGLPLAELPDTYEAAKKLMTTRHGDCYPKAELKDHQRLLLESFFTAFGEEVVLKKYLKNYTKGSNPKPEFTSLCSSRMSQYLKDTGRVGENKKDLKKL